MNKLKLKQDHFLLRRIAICAIVGALASVAILGALNVRATDKASPEPKPKPDKSALFLKLSIEQRDTLADLCEQTKGTALDSGYCASVETIQLETCKRYILRARDYPGSRSRECYGIQEDDSRLNSIYSITF